jgi:hypothetical protein
MASDTLTRPARGTRPVASRRPVGTIDLIGLVGLGCWAYGLSAIELGHMGSTGLISVLPGVGLIGLVLVVSAFVLQLATDPQDRWRPALYLVVLVVMLDGLPCIVESSGDVPTGYIHVGFIGYILDHGRLLENYDARFSWPGMFAWSALATVTGGRSNALVYLRWTPLALDLAYLLPLRLLLRRCCPNPRTAWMAAAVFVLTNWVQQDYFSPQGFAYVGYLSVLAVLLACTSPRRRPATLDSPVAAADRRSLRRLLAPAPSTVLDLRDPRSRVAVIVLLVVVMGAAVTSHELTPYALVIELAVLAIVGRRVSFTLIAVLVVLSLGYLSFGAENFWANHLSTIFGGVGHVGGSVSSGLVSRTHVSAGHQLVVEGRLVYTAILLGAAAAGALIGRSSGWADWKLVSALAVAPWVLVGLQSYGGEVFIRSLFFSLPFLAILAAEPLVWILERPRIAVGSAVATITVAALVLAASLALIVTRYGNEPFYLTTPTEIAAVRWVDQNAAPGATIAVLNQNLPWRFEDIDRYTFVSYQAKCQGLPGASCLQHVDADYVIMTESETEDAELEGGFSTADVERLVTATLPDAGYRVVLHNADTEVFARSGPSAAATGGGQ